MKKQRTKSPLFPILSILFATLLAAVIPTEAEGAIYADTLRVHILANSDEEIDQDLKIKIRNRILEKYSSVLVGVEDMETARAIISERTENIREDVDSWILEEGFSYTSTVELGCEWYDTREYESFTLPAGYYTSLRVILGEGEGKNWWCVMFPPLCLDIATSAKAPEYSAAEEKLIGRGKYSVKFKLLELCEEAVSKFSKRG